MSQTAVALFLLHNYEKKPLAAPAPLPDYVLMYSLLDSKMQSWNKWMTTLVDEHKKKQNAVGINNSIAWHDFNFARHNISPDL